MLELLTEYGITLETAMSFDTLVKLRSIYEANISSLVGERDKNESTDSELKKYLLATTSQESDVAETVKNFASEVRAMFYRMVDDNPRTIFALVEAMSDLKTDSLNERDHWLGKVKREANPTKPVDVEYEAKREDTGKLAELIRQLYPLLANLVPTDKRGDEFGPENFPLEQKKSDGKPTGEFLPKLSRLPRSQADDNPTGRAVQNRYLVFTWNGNEIPSGTLPSDVAHDYVSDFKAGYVIDWTGIRDLAKKAGVETFSDKPWSHDFPTGTLTIQDRRLDKPERNNS